MSSSEAVQIPAPDVDKSKNPKVAVDQFKRVKRPNFRQRTQEQNDISGNFEEPTISLEELRETQKLRKRPHGVSIEDLAASRGSGKEGSPVVDPELSKMQTGGMVSLRTARAMAALPSLESGGQHIDIGTEFSAETQRRDEDYDMMKFIEDEIAKRKISTVNIPTGEVSSVPLQITRAEDALLVVAEQYQRNTGKKSEEMLSHQMLSGIPEIDLGIEAKIKNIEATEEAKRRLMQKYREGSPDTRQTSKSATESAAMNYMQHVRYNMDHYKEPKPEKSAAATKVPAVDGTKSTVTSRDPTVSEAHNTAVHHTKPEKASDGAYYERFKKNFMDKLEKEKKPKRGE